MSARVRTNSHKNQISTCSLLDVKLIKLGITKNEGPFMTAVLRVNLFNLQMRGIKSIKLSSDWANSVLFAAFGC